MSGNLFGCIIWCSSAFTSLPGLESFPLGSNCLFHLLIPPPSFTTLTVGPSCATHLLSCLEQASLDVVPDILSGPISYTCRCTHMQVDLLEMIASLRVFKLPNFKTRDEPELWWHINPHVAYKKLILQGYFLIRDHFFHMCAWSYGKGWSLSAWLPFLTYVMRWLSGFLKRSQEAGWMLGHTPGFSLPQHLVPACHTPTHHALPLYKFVCSTKQQILAMPLANSGFVFILKWQKFLLILNWQIMYTVIT